MIVFDGVSKVFSPVPGRSGPVTALDDVSLELERGGVWAVVGPNGAGKTTFLGLLLGFLNASEGTVRIDAKHPRQYLRRHGSAYLPERFHLPGEWTVLAALLALARLEGLSATAARRRAKAAIERLGLDRYARRRVGTLSRGLLQRVGLAQTLLGDRDLIVLDEPTEGLDPLWRVRFRELVAELRDPGRIILIASHDLSELERMADHALLLEDGRVRDTFEIQPAPSTTVTYRLELVGLFSNLGDYFPDARREPVEGQGSDGGQGPSYTVRVTDEGDLNDRLSALLAAGGRVRSLRPLAEAFEDRVHRALAGGEG